MLCEGYKRYCLETLELVVRIVDSHQKILASEGHDYSHVLDNLAESTMRGREES